MEITLFFFSKVVKVTAVVASIHSGGLTALEPYRHRSLALVWPPNCTFSLFTLYKMDNLKATYGSISALQVSDGKSMVCKYCQAKMCFHSTKVAKYISVHKNVLQV